MTAGTPARQGGGVVVPVVGWLVGVVLLWASPRWRTGDKLLGTLVWPGGLLAPAGLVLLGGGGALVATSSTGCGSSPVLTGSPTSQGVGVAFSGPAIPAPHDRSFLAHHVISASTCTSSPAVLPPWLVILLAAILLAAAVGGPVFTAVRLLRRAGQAPHGLTADPAAYQPA